MKQLLASLALVCWSIPALSANFVELTVTGLGTAVTGDGCTTRQPDCVFAERYVQFRGTRVVDIESNLTSGTNLFLPFGAPAIGTLSNFSATISYEGLRRGSQSGNLIEITPFSSGSGQFNPLGRQGAILFPLDLTGVTIRQLSSGASGPSSTEVFQVLGPVPEPATWGLMVLGLGLIGAAVRRQARVHALGTISGL